jgi:hypothetical protein
MKIATYDAYSMACGMAYEDLLSCLGTAECAALVTGTACSDEIAAQELACAGAGTTTASSTGDGG